MNTRSAARLGRQLLPFLVGCAMFATAPFVAENFLRFGNLVAIATSCLVLLPAAIGMQALLVAGRFDLSLGALSALIGVITALGLSWGFSWYFAAIVALLCGLLISTFTALMVSVFRFDVLIATLAMMWIARSLALVLADGKTIGPLFDEVGEIAAARVLGIDVSLLVAVGFALLVAFMLRFQLHCRRLYAVGSNESAARSAGINVVAELILAFGIATAGAAVTGLIQLVRSESASPLVFQELSLECIAACVLGGAALRGGRGSVLGACLGLLVVVALRNFVLALEVHVYWRYLAIGVLLLIATALDRATRVQH